MAEKAKKDSTAFMTHQGKLISSGISCNWKYCRFKQGLLVNLACWRHSSQKTLALNVVFLINTGSPVSCQSESVFKTLLPPDSKIPRIIDVQIHTEKVIQCYLSPKDKHFVDVNVLGMDFVVKNNISNLSILIDYDLCMIQLTYKQLPQ